MGKHLMSVADLKTRLGVSRQRAYQLSQLPHFPVPYDEVNRMRVWRIEDINTWLREHRPGLADDADEPG